MALDENNFSLIPANQNCYNVPMRQEEVLKLQRELDKLHRQLAIFYEISNAMRTTLKLDEILYIILTAITSHAGLGFNRAILFLVNPAENLLEGKMGIGPGSGEEAQKIWHFIETSRMTLQDLIDQYKRSRKVSDSRLNQLVKNFVISISPENGILAQAVLDGQIRHITEKELPAYQDDPIIKELNSKEFVVIPLKAHDKVVGVILADNIFSGRPITEEDIKMLTMFANQAGLAIENSILYEQALLRAHTDSLTQLWNHGYFQHKLDELISQQEDETRPISLLFIDIDDFKKFNDQNGHQKGDEVLRNIARILKEQSRKIDLVCRYGGEEFAIILPDTTKEEAIRIAERLRTAVESAGLPTLSIGVATYPQDAKTKEELIELADAALYKAKRLGKNQVQTV